MVVTARQIIMLDDHGYGLSRRRVIRPPPA